MVGGLRFGKTVWIVVWFRLVLLVVVSWLVLTLVLRSLGVGLLF